MGVAAGGWGRWVWQQVGGVGGCGGRWVGQIVRQVGVAEGGWVGGRWVSLAGQVYKLVVKGWGCAGKQLSDGVSVCMCIWLAG